MDEQSNKPTDKPKKAFKTPTEAMLRTLTITALENLLYITQRVITRKRKHALLGFRGPEVYEKLVALLLDKTLRKNLGALPPGTVLTSDIINNLDAKDLQFIDIDNHEVEMKVYAALKPFRGPDGKLRV